MIECSFSVFKEQTCQRPERGQARHTTVFASRRIDRMKHDVSDMTWDTVLRDNEDSPEHEHTDCFLEQISLLCGGMELVLPAEEAAEELDFA